MSTPTTTTVNAYTTDHYMAAAKWAKGIEGLNKVQRISAEDNYTVVRIDSDRILRSAELASLAKICRAKGLEFVLSSGKFSNELIIIIDKP
jgi:hypothetical protein